MTSTNKGTKIISDFFQSTNHKAGFSARRTSISRQVFKIVRSKSCLIYVKSRSAEPFKWGVTANVINRLFNQDLPWFVILLFISHETGYLLTSNDVEYYIQNVMAFSIRWRL